jgi:hypothetical protein
MIRFYSVLSIILSCLLVSGAFASEPLESFSFSGRLANNTGLSVSGSVTLSMTATLFEDAIGGTAEYVQVYPGVVIEDGFFHLLIGPALPDLVRFSYLELEVEGQILAPRRKFLTQPFAIHASRAMVAENSQRFGGFTTSEFKDHVYHSIGVIDSTSSGVLRVGSLGVANEILLGSAGSQDSIQTTAVFIHPFSVDLSGNLTAIGKIRASDLRAKTLKLKEGLWIDQNFGFGDESVNGAHGFIPVFSVDAMGSLTAQTIVVQRVDASMIFATKFVGDGSMLTGLGGSTFIRDGDKDTGLQVEDSADEDRIIMGTDGVERVTITKSGDVGIGTTTPQSRLDVLGIVRATAFEGDGSKLKLSFPHTLESSSTRIELDANTTGTPPHIHVEVDGVESMFISSIGVGIGVSFPTEALEVSGMVLASQFSGDGTSLTNVLHPGDSISADQVMATTLGDGFATLSGGMFSATHVQATSFSGSGAGLSNLPPQSLIESDDTRIEIDTVSGSPPHIHIQVDGVEPMFISSIGVGIGVSFPTEALEVSGMVLASQFSGDGTSLTNVLHPGDSISADQVMATTLSDGFATLSGGILSATHVQATSFSGDGSGLSGILIEGMPLSTSQSITMTADGGKGLVIQHSAAETSDTTKIVVRDDLGTDVFRVNEVGEIRSGNVYAVDIHAQKFFGDGGQLSGIFSSQIPISTTQTITLTADGGQALIIEHSTSETPGTTKIAVRNPSGDAFVVSVDGDLGFFGYVRRLTSTLYGNQSFGHTNLGDFSETGETGQNRQYATVGGGNQNQAKNDYSTVSGGLTNTASGAYSSIGGGVNNQGLGNYSVISGGDGNVVGGNYSAIPGGSLMTLNAGDAFAFNGTGTSQTVTAGLTGAAIFMVSRLGIGTTNPMTTVDILGDLNVSGQYLVNGSPQVSGSSPFTDNSTHIVYNGGNLGLGVNDPEEQLVLEGRMRMNPNTDVAGFDGTIRWTGNDLEVKNAGNWISLTASSSSTGVAVDAFDDYVFLADVKSSGTDAGSAPASAWSTRDLQTVFKDDGNLVQLSANRFTLQAGSYYLRADAPAYKVTRHVLRLVISDTQQGIATGTAAYANSAGVVQSRSFLSAQLSLTTSETFEIQHWTEFARTGDGFGLATNQGDELYTRVEIWLEDGSSDTASSGNAGATGQDAFIGSGTGNTASATGAFAGAGTNNQATGLKTFVGSGDGNRASGDYSSVAGGQANTSTADYGFVGGGSTNSVNADYSFVGGGVQNAAGGSHSVIVGGNNNQTQNINAFVGAGLNNLASGSNSVVAGGQNNTAAGDYSVVPGGRMMTLSGADSFGFNGTGASQAVTSGVTGAAIFMVSRFGIGTTTPHVELEVEGDGIFASGLQVGFTQGLPTQSRINIGDALFYLDLSAPTAPTLAFDPNDYLTYNRNFDIYQWISGGNEVMRLDSSGSLSVGTATTIPGLKVWGPQISVDYTGEARYHLYNRGNTAEWVFGQKSGSDHDFKISKSVAASESDYLIIKTDGKVGIGTTFPGATLEVNGVTKATDIQFSDSTSLGGDLVAFSAYRNSTQSITSGAEEVVIFNAEDYDYGTNFDTGSGVFTAPVDGFYEFRAQVLWSTAADQSRLIVILKKNGSLDIARRETIASGTQGHHSALSRTVVLMASDTIDVHVSQDTGDGRNISAGSGDSYFEGRLIRQIPPAQ